SYTSPNDPSPHPHLFSIFSFSMNPPPPRSTLFRYTTLFRSPLELSNFAVAPIGQGAVARALDNSSITPPAYVDSLVRVARVHIGDRKSTRLNSSHVAISYAVFCLKKKKIITSIPQSQSNVTQ